MNLHGIVRGAIGAVNPDTVCTVYLSAGYSTAADGSRTPAYSVLSGIRVQVQALDGPDLKQIEGLNISSLVRGMYFYGDYESIVRKASKGGDLIWWAGSAWKIVKVLETWPDWCHVAVTQQLDAAPPV